MQKKLLLSPERAWCGLARRKIEIVKAALRTHVASTTTPALIATVRSKNEFFEVPLTFHPPYTAAAPTTWIIAHLTTQTPDKLPPHPMLPPL